MIGSTFKTMVATHLNRDDMTAIIATCCDLAVKKLERECLWFQMSSTSVATAASTGSAALPSGFIRELKDGFRDTSGVALKKEKWSKIDYWQRYSAGGGEPDHYAIADKFYFYPIPDTIYALPLQYYKSLGFPANDASNAWTDQVYDLTFWQALEEIWRHIGDDAEMLKARAMKTEILRDVGSQSGRLVGVGRVEYKEY